MSSKKFGDRIKSLIWRIKEYYNIFSTVFFRFIVLLHRRSHKLADKEVYIGFSSGWFGGNVKGLLDAILKDKNLVKKNRIHVYFTSPNKDQVEIAKKEGIEAYWRRDFRAIPVFSKTQLFICSHGESFLPVTRRRYFRDFFMDALGEFGSRFSSKRKDFIGRGFSVKRLELWHGVPFKDVYIDKIPIPPDVFCVTSEFMKKCYAAKGYDPSIFRVTGYPCNDILFEKIDKKKILSKLGIPKDKKIILYAPTWGHFSGKGLFPWEKWKDTFVLFDDFAKEAGDVFFVIRTHRYWEGERDGDVKDVLSKCSNIAWIPMENFPDTYLLLAATDVLITDWSSIAFDFMLKRKPIIFIDCPNPYGKFCFTPSERAGAVVKNPDELINAVRESIKDSEGFVKTYAPNFDEVLDKAFSYKDGKSSERCIKEMMKLLEK